MSDGVQDAFACLDSTNLEKLAELMYRNELDGIPIVASNNQILGIVTLRDIVMEAIRTHLPLWQIRALDLLQRSSP